MLRMNQFSRGEAFLSRKRDVGRKIYKKNTSVVGIYLELSHCGLFLPQTKSIDWHYSFAIIILILVHEFVRNNVPLVSTVSSLDNS